MSLSTILFLPCVSALRGCRKQTWEENLDGRFERTCTARSRKMESILILHIWDFFQRKGIVVTNLVPVVLLPLSLVNRLNSERIAVRIKKKICPIQSSSICPSVMDKWLMERRNRSRSLHLCFLFQSQVCSPYCQESTEYFFPLFATGKNICKANTNPNKFLQFLSIIPSPNLYFSFLSYFSPNALYTTVGKRYYWNSCLYETLLGISC